jgi:RNA polymerase primary sigma factor
MPSIQKMLTSSEHSNEEQTFLTQVIDKRSRESVDELVEADDLNWIVRGPDLLDVRKAMVIRMRFGLGQYSPMTLQRVAEQFGLTRERVRQLEREALQQLRELPRFERSGPTDISTR